MEQMAPEFGAGLRCLCVIKVRVRRFFSGPHDVNLGTGELRVCPRLVPAGEETKFARGVLPTRSDRLTTFWAAAWTWGQAFSLPVLLAQAY